MRSLADVRVSARQIGRCQHPLHAAQISCGAAIPLIHIATTNPFRFRRGADLLRRAVIANHSPHRMGAVAAIVARLHAIDAAAATGAQAVIDDAVVPVVVVICHAAIPTAIACDQRWMLPRVTGVFTGDHYASALDSKRPKLRCPDQTLPGRCCANHR